MGTLQLNNPGCEDWCNNPLFWKSAVWCLPWLVQNGTRTPRKAELFSPDLPHREFNEFHERAMELKLGRHMMGGVFRCYIYIELYRLYVQPFLGRIDPIHSYFLS